MDQVKSLVSERTGHDESNITCSHDTDYYFCTASDYVGQDFDNPDSARCWRVMFIEGQAEFSGPANYYCP
jgi:hypothetical protein